MNTTVLKRFKSLFCEQKCNNNNNNNSFLIRNCFSTKMTFCEFNYFIPIDFNTFHPCSKFNLGYHWFRHQSIRVSGSQNHGLALFSVKIYTQPNICNRCPQHWSIKKKLLPKAHTF